MKTDLTPLISIVIPVKNGAATIEAALQGLLAQTLADRAEIMVIDSGSKDGTLDIVRRYPVIIHEIPPAEFNHGATRNLGVQQTRGEFVVMTVQDAVPADAHWLATMLRHFDDPAVAGVCGKQITTHDQDKNPMEWHRPMSAPQVTRVQFTSRQDYDALPGHARMAASAWDDVTSMYRKSALLDLPFRTTMFGEDFFWANDALSSGWTLVHDDNAMVNHYHDQPFLYRLRRVLTIYYHQNFLYGVYSSPDPWLFKIGQCTWYIYRKLRLSPLRKLYWIIYNYKIITADWLAYLLSYSTLALTGSKGFDKLHQALCKFAPQAKVRTSIDFDYKNSKID